MKRVPNRKRLRREYLKKKGQAYATMAVGAAGIVLCASGLRELPSLFRYSSGTVPTVGLAIVVCISVVTTIIFIGVLWAFTRGAKEEASAIPYVPPVTSDTLPADEVLVRGALEPPVEHSTVLLRPAASHAESPSAQMLRSSEPTTPSTLPAEEILVRGVEEPSVPSETLLRATVTGKETKADETSLF